MKLGETPWGSSTYYEGAPVRDIKEVLFNGIRYWAVLEVHTLDWRAKEQLVRAKPGVHDWWMVDAEIYNLTKPAALVWHHERKFNDLKLAKYFAEQLRTHMDSLNLEDLLKAGQATKHPEKMVKFPKPVMPSDSVVDKIAKALARKHAKVITASGWFTEADHSVFNEQEEVVYQTARVMLGGVEITCKIAGDSDLQVRGLNGHQSLGMYEGMIFPQEQPRRVAFHMDQVVFPIDMIFVASDSRISKIVENVEPGQPGQWGMPHVLAVIEVNGGFCAAHDIQVGSEVGQLDSREAQNNTEPLGGYPAEDEAVQVGQDALEEGQDFNTPAMMPLQDEAVALLKEFARIDRAGRREALLPKMSTLAGKYLIKFGLVEMRESTLPRWEGTEGPVEEGHGGIPPAAYVPIKRPPLPFLTPQGKNYLYALVGKMYGEDPVRPPGVNRWRDVEPGVTPMRPVVKGRLAQMYKVAQSKGLQPAFKNMDTGEIVVSPGVHDISILPIDPAYMDPNTPDDELNFAPPPWNEGFVDKGGKYYTRGQASKLFDVGTSDDLLDMEADLEQKIAALERHAQIPPMRNQDPALCPECGSVNIGSDPYMPEMKSPGVGADFGTCFDCDAKFLIDDLGDIRPLQVKYNAQLDDYKNILIGSIPWSESAIQMSYSTAIGVEHPIKHAEKAVADVWMRVTIETMHDRAVEIEDERAKEGDMSFIVDAEVIDNQIPDTQEAPFTFHVEKKFKDQQQAILYFDRVKTWIDSMTLAQLYQIKRNSTGFSRFQRRLSQLDMPPELSEQLANTMFPEAMVSLKTIWPNLSGIFLYAYLDTLGACPISGQYEDGPEIYYDGDEWIIFGAGPMRTAQYTDGPHRLQPGDEVESIYGVNEYIDIPIPIGTRGIVSECPGELRGDGYVIVNFHKPEWAGIGMYENELTLVNRPKPGRWSEHDITTKMREMKYKRKLSLTQAVTEIILMGAAGSSEPQGDEIKYLQSLYKSAQATFPKHPLKEVNPKMVTPNVTRDRFKSHDMIDKQLDSPAFSPLQEESTDGFDLTVDIHDENSGLGPNRQ